jgi:hypothetical protein
MNTNKTTLLIFLSIILFFTTQSFVWAEDGKIPPELLDLLVSFPIQSGEVDINVTMDKDQYTAQEIPQLFISGYNKRDTPASMDIHIGFIGPDGTVYEYPDWNPSRPWLPAFNIPSNYQLSPTFITTTAGIPGLSAGKWHAAAGLIEPGTDKLVSFMVFPFEIESVDTEPPLIDPKPSDPSGIPSPARLTTPPDGMIGIWDLIDYGIGAGGIFTLIDNFVMVFEDGTFTDDISKVLNEGIAASKADPTPKSHWGEWRINGEEIEVKWSFDEKFSTPVRQFRAEAGGNEQRLEGCFSSSVSTSTLPNDLPFLLRVSKWCFKPDGTFDHSKAATASSGDFVGWGTSPTESGSYYIDGYIMVFSYNDGRVINAGFSFLVEDHSHILINTIRYR